MYFSGRPLPGLIISGKNTYTEWEMIPMSRLYVKPPDVKTSYVDLPGADGGIDYTDLLIGQPTFGYRKGSWEFFLIPGERWAEVYRSLCSYLHGKTHTVILEDDDNYVYYGRLSVNDWQSAAHNSRIVIDYQLNPNPERVEGHDQSEDEILLQESAKLLRKIENQNKIIVLQNDVAVLADKDAYFESRLIDTDDEYW